MSYEKDLINAAKANTPAELIRLFQQEGSSYTTDTLHKIFDAAGFNFANATLENDPEKLSKSKQILDYLCDNKLHEAMCQRDGLRPFDSLFYFGYFEKIQSLYTKHKITSEDLNSQAKNGFTPFHAASSSIYTKLTFPLIEWLLSIPGIKINTQDKKNRKTPFHSLLSKSSQSDFSDMIKLFVTHGADINAPDVCGRTPAFEAIGQPNLKHLEVLYSLGVDFFAPTQWGGTIEDYAQRQLRDEERLIQSELKREKSLVLEAAEAHYAELQKIITYFNHLKQTHETALKQELQNIQQGHTAHTDLDHMHADITQIKRELASIQEMRLQQAEINKDIVAHTVYYQVKHLATKLFHVYEALSTGKLQRTKDTAEQISGWIRELGHVASFIPGVAMVVHAGCTTFEFVHATIVEQEIRRIDHLTNANGVDQDIEEAMRLFTVHLLSQLHAKNIELTTQGAEKLANCVVARLLHFAAHDKSLDKHIPTNGGRKLFTYMKKAIEAQMKKEEEFDTGIKTVQGTAYSDRDLFAMINFNVQIPAAVFVTEEATSSADHSPKHSLKDSPSSSPGSTPPKSPTAMQHSDSDDEEKVPEESAHNLISRAADALEAQVQRLKFLDGNKKEKIKLLHETSGTLRALLTNAHCSGQSAYSIILNVQSNYNDKPDFRNLLDCARKILEPMAAHQTSITQPSAPSFSAVYTNDLGYPKQAFHKPVTPVSTSLPPPTLPARSEEQLSVSYSN